MNNSIFSLLSKVLKVPANWFLLFLVVITAVNSYFWMIETKSNLNQNLNPKTVLSNHRMRVVTQLKSKFNNQFVLQDNQNNQWLLKTKDKLDIGYQYNLDSKLDYFELDSGECQKPKLKSNSNTITKIIESEKCFDRQNYYLSSGYIGELQEVKNIVKNLDCDWLCESLKLQDNIKFRFRYFFDSNVCKELHFVNIWFNSRCDQILAWSYGLVLGQGDLFDFKTKQNLQKLGITHLVVVSGFQVGLIFSWLEWLTLKLRIRLKWRTIIGWIGTLFLVVLVGFQAPVLRSIVGLVLSSSCLVFFGRRLDQWRSLVFSAIILLWIFPNFLISYSFWLSFVASFGLLMVVSGDNDYLETVWLKNIWSLFWSCLSTFLFTLPLIANLVGQVSFTSIIPNLILIPLIPAITIANLLSALPVIGEIFGLVVIVAQNFLQIVITDLGSVVGTTKIQSFGLLEMVIYWIILACSLQYIQRLLLPQKQSKTLI